MCPPAFVGVDLLLLLLPLLQVVCMSLTESKGTLHRVHTRSFSVSSADTCSTTRNAELCLAQVAMPQLRQWCFRSMIPNLVKQMWQWSALIPLAQPRRHFLLLFSGLGVIVFNSVCCVLCCSTCRPFPSHLPSTYICTSYIILSKGTAFSRGLQEHGWDGAESASPPAGIS